MVKVLHCLAVNTDDAYVLINAAGAPLWVGFDIWFEAGLPGPGDGYGYFQEFKEAGPNDGTGLFLIEDSGDVKWYTDRASNGPFAALVTGQWYHVDFKYTPGSPLDEELWIDGVDQGVTNGSNNVDAVDQVGFGLADLGGDETGWEFYIANIAIGTTKGGVDVWNETLVDIATFDGTVEDGVVQTLEVIDDPTGSAPGSEPASLADGQRVLIAFDDDMLEDDPDWTAIDDVAVNLVSHFDWRTGRANQFERTGVGTANVYLNDQDGLFDPNNASSPYFGKLDGKQIRLQVYDPTTLAWVPQYTGLIDDYYTVLNPATEDGVSINANIRIECVDMFDYLGGYEMIPGLVGDTPPAGSEGCVFFEDADWQTRVVQLLTAASIPSARQIVFTGNIDVQESLYDAGDAILTGIRDACDAELPSVANAFIDKLGRFHAHGRGAKFDPDGVAASATPGAWNFKRLKAGDGAAITIDPDCAQIRALEYNRPRRDIINAAIAWPRGVAEADIPGQAFTDATSITDYGYHAQPPMSDLIIAAGTTTGFTANQECAKYAEMMVTNLKDPKNRIRRVTFKSLDPTDARAEKTWEVLVGIDIGDVLELTVGYPGGTGIDEGFFVEGISGSCTPLNATHDLIEVSLDVSPESDFADPVGLMGT